MYKKIIAILMSMLVAFSVTAPVMATEVGATAIGAYTDEWSAREALGELITAAVEILQSPDFSKNPSDVCERFEKAFGEANEVYYNPASSLQELNAQIESLQSVIDEVKKPSVSQDAAYYLASVITDAQFNVGFELDYTAQSWAVFVDALLNAKDVQISGKTDKEVYEAADALKSAMDSLEPVSSAIIAAREYLRSVINNAYFVLSSDVKYTLESIKILEDTIAAAELVYYDASATAGQLYYQADLVTNTIYYMSKIEISDEVRNYLAGVIVDADSQVGDEDEYTPESWSVYFDAYQEAVRVQSVGETEEEFISAADALSKAIEALVPVDAEVAAAKEALMTVIKEAHLLLSSGEKYTAESTERLHSALESANVLYVRENVTEEQLIAETKALQSAIDLLKKIIISEDVIFYLEGVIALADSKVSAEENYTPESWEIYLNTYKEAKRVMYEGESDEEFITAADALGTAIESLVSADEELNKARSELLRLIEYSVTRDIYTAESLKNYDHVKEEATAVYNNENATCEEVKSQTDLLQGAIDSLELIPINSKAKDELALWIASADEVEFPEGVTFNTKSEFSAAYENAKLVFSNATNDGDYTEASDRLRISMENLMDEARQILKKMINRGAPVGGNYTSSSMAALMNALDEAGVVYDNENSELKEILSQIQKLDTAYRGLQITPITPVAKQTLWNVIEESQVVVGDREDYTPESWDVYRDAYSDAMATYHYGQSDEEYYLAAQKLRGAIDGLVPKATDDPSDPDVNTPTPDEVYVLLGDADGNGKVNVKDATFIQKCVAGIATHSGNSAYCSDANMDGKVNVRDATEIQKFLAGLNANVNIGTNISVTLK